MPLDDLWPPFPTSRILHQDADLVAIDKPPFLPTHAPERSDDVVRRLTEYFGSEGKTPGYLGVHQRLERDISGVLVLTRRREANRSIAEQMEQRKVKRTYLALVTGTPGMPGRGKAPDYGVLRHRLVSISGAHRVLPATAREGTPSTISFRVLERRGAFTLLALTPEPGCVIDLPAQLGAEGAPLVGDLERGGQTAHRLALHLSDLVLTHPENQRPLKIEARMPTFFRDWLDGTDPLTHVNVAERRLREAAERRLGIGRLANTDCFRLANAEADGLPGVTVDRYGEYLVVSLYDEAAMAAREVVFDAVMALGAAGVYVKNRPKHASRIVDAHRDEFAPKTPVRGTAHPESFLIHELGLPFEVRLGDGLSTGIFLDQRENRRRVREMAKGLSVANLFAYTGAFSVAAAAGGAKSTLTVDVSPSVLEWAETNLRRIGADPAKHRVLEADVMKWLEHGAKKDGLFDLVILDPPSFATTKQSRFSAESDYKKLAAMAMRVLSPGGRLLACTNHKGIGPGKFRRVLQDAARDAGRTISQIKDWPAPEDVPAEPGKDVQLKSVFVVLDGAARR
ncbi:MAG TPA: class I SAM-dependent methyltransferase [Polyangium sp.]|nr:class I SAM-dependent methyltransferase [Polyangium sp.]